MDIAAAVRGANQHPGGADHRRLNGGRSGHDGPGWAGRRGAGPLAGGQRVPSWAGGFPADGGGAAGPGCPVPRAGAGRLLADLLHFDY